MRKRTIVTSTRLLLLIALAISGMASAAAPAMAEDITPPAVTAFSLAPSHLDTSAATQTVTASLAVADSQSGVDFVQIELFSPDTSQYFWSQAKLVSGDASSGMYAWTYVLPKGSMPGTWHAWVSAKDTLGNLTSLPWLQLDVLFGAGSSEVVNDASTWDTATPEVSAVNITPSHVDTSTSEQTVDVTVTVTDDQSGLDFATGLLHGGASGNGQHLVVPLKRIDGDELSGVYEATVTLPRYSASGPWTLYVTARDMVGNVLVSADLAEQFGTSGQLIDDAAVADTSPPLVTALSITPAEFDTESGAQDLAVTASVTDDLAGVETVAAIVRPLLTEQLYVATLKRSSGDALDGVWSGTITVPGGAAVGVWKSEVDVYDAISNWVWYGADELNAMVPDAQGVTLVNTAQAEQVTVRKEWVLTGESSSVTFLAGTVVTRQGGGPFAFYKMVAQPFTFDGGVPTEDLSGEPVATLRFGIPGLGLSFSQPVSVRMRVGTAYDGYVVHIQSLSESGDSWSNETESEVAGGWVGFTVSHATRFAASMANASATRLSPSAGKRGAKITIVGKGFGAKRRDSVVLFGKRACPRYTSWTPTRIVCIVPATAKPGRLSVTVRTKAGTSRALHFTVKR